MEKMFKTKLQELCHKNRWPLPKYSLARDGPDHNPRFTASVSVNGRSFQSSVACRSSRDAHNDVATLAFVHFAAPVSELADVTAEPFTKGPEIDKSYKSSDDRSDISDGIKGLLCQYKNQLKNYARWKKLGLPLYSSRSESLLNALRYKATVTVDGRPFESAEFFNTLEEAEHAAAKAALFSLSLDDFREDFKVSYKNLLQELAQVEGFCMPIYNTVRFGACHPPTYISTVEVNGEQFSGKKGKSKKESEQEAAKIAYSVLKEREPTAPLSDGGLIQRAMFTCPKLVREEALQTTPSPDSTMTADPQQNLKNESQLLSIPAIKYEECANEIEEAADATHILPTNAKFSMQDSSASPLAPEVDEMIVKGNSSSSFQAVPPSPKEGFPSDPTLAYPDLSALSVSDKNKGKTAGTKSFLLCNRVRVYPCFPDIPFPEGITVLPISDDKWVAVSLEFPNEKNN